MLAGLLTAGAAKKPITPNVNTGVNNSVILPGTQVAGIHFMAIGYTQDELNVLAVSDRLVNEVFNSNCFKTFMTTGSLIQTLGLSPAQVVEKLKNTSIMIPTHAYYADNQIVGYRNPPYPDIYTNRKFVGAGASACSRASNMAHESSHVIGFDHDFNVKYMRQFSVPYKTNSAFIQCCHCKKIVDCWVDP